MTRVRLPKRMSKKSKMQEFLDQLKKPKRSLIELLKSMSGELQEDDMVLVFGSGADLDHETYALEALGDPIFSFDAESTDFNGDFFLDARKATIEGIEDIRGDIADTIPAFLAEHSEEVGLIYFACSPEIATRALEILYAHDALQPGTLLVFSALCQFEDSNFEYWQAGQWSALHSVDIDYKPIARTRYEAATVRIV